MSEWPMVAPNDDGIRPAGAPDECLYCRAKVGQPHGRECVIVTKRIEMRVRAAFADGSEAHGLWQLDEPYAWDVDMSEFHKNESSWCAGNLLAFDSVTWSDPDAHTKLSKLHDDDESCLCNELTFEFARVVDDTPQRKLRTTDPQTGNPPKGKDT